MLDKIWSQVQSSLFEVTQLILVFLLFMPQSFAKEMTCTLVETTDKSAFLAFPENAACIGQPLTDEELKKMLKKDRTNRHEFNEDVANEQKWFVCHQFSTQFMLRLSCFHIDSSYQLLELKTPIRYTDSINGGDIKKSPFFIAGFNGTKKMAKTAFITRSMPFTGAEALLA